MFLSVFGKVLRNKHIVQTHARGFTLVELLVVVSIIGFLSTLTVLSVNDSRTKSYDTARLSDVFDIQKALELYAADFGFYPVGNGIDLGSANYTCLSEAGFTSICPPNAKVFMGIVPESSGPGVDPYVYTRTIDAQSYTITFTLQSDVGNISAGAHTLTPAGVE